MADLFTTNQRLVTFTPQIGDADSYEGTVDGTPWDAICLAVFGGVRHNPEEAMEINDSDLRLFIPITYQEAVAALSVGDHVTVEGIVHEVQRIDSRGVLPTSRYPLRVEARRV